MACSRPQLSREAADATSGSSGFRTAPRCPSTPWRRNRGQRARGRPAKGGAQWVASLRPFALPRLAAPGSSPPRSSRRRRSGASDEQITPLLPRTLRASERSRSRAANPGITGPHARGAWPSRARVPGPRRSPPSSAAARAPVGRVQGSRPRGEEPRHASHRTLSKLASCRPCRTTGVAVTTTIAAPKIAAPRSRSTSTSTCRRRGLRVAIRRGPGAKARRAPARRGEARRGSQARPGEKAGDWQGNGGQNTARGACGKRKKRAAR